jgi:phosphate/sulfate permease
MVALLPVELIQQAGQGSGFAMVFALLLSATGWNLATWYAGLPVSSSHALIGAIIGVGLVHSLLHGAGISGVDWSQALAVGRTLLVSPLIGFGGAALLLATVKTLISNPGLHRAPGGTPPPGWIRCLLILTCAGVSFAHGSNDGQKGMGLIMLILIGLLPATYAIDGSADQQFVPLWVKLGVALALGVGTTFGWKRVVVTVGERIGKSQLTYAQGAAAEFVAMATIFGADSSGLPVSTTHVLSSGVAGTMAANGSGLQWTTVGKLATAWLLTLPAVMSLSAAFYLIFRAWV